MRGEVHVWFEGQGRRNRVRGIEATVLRPDLTQATGKTFRRTYLWDHHAPVSPQRGDTASRFEPRMWIVPPT